MLSRPALSAVGSCRLPDGPAAAVTFLLAGQFAAGTRHGAGADDKAITAELRSAPSRDRVQVRRDATRAAKRIVVRNGGEIRRYARRLDEKGAL